MDFGKAAGLLDNGRMEKPSCRYCVADVFFYKECFCIISIKRNINYFSFCALYL